MLFNSLEFAFFFAVVVIVYFSLPFRFRVWFLLVASYYFYMRWRAEYLLLILAQTTINYDLAKRIKRAHDRIVKKLWLMLALMLSLGLLGVFKYFNFFSENVGRLLGSAGLDYLIPHLDFLLPVGISFYTFQTLSYTIDVYRGDHDLEPDFGRFALYVAFFPQLVAGPIERATHLLDQFKRQNHFDLQRVSEGMKLILWGLFKKVVIADRLAIYVDRVYEQPEIYSGSTLLLATYFFAFQIYCDFSGYSDIAIGSARILGYDLMQNFRLPYLAESIADFWKRWHISLTSWFRSYLFIPLGGSRVSYFRWLLNVSLVFLISGLWHGASWTFVIWGALHAAYYFAESILEKLIAVLSNRPLLPRVLSLPIRVLVTFHLVLIAWIFFRAASVDQAFFIVNRIVTDLGGTLYRGPSQVTTALSIFLILILIIVQLLQSSGHASLYFSKTRLPAIVRWTGYIGLIFGIALLGLSSQAFIYFQF